MNLETLLADEQLFHSEYQLEYFIIRKCGTPYAQYKQAIRELSQRVQALRGLFVKSKELEFRIRELQLAVDTIPNTETARIKHERHLLELQQADWNRDQLARTLKDTYREFSILFKLAASLKASIGDLGNREELEAKQWAYEAKLRLAIDMTTSGACSKETWGLILALEPSVRFDLVSSIKAANLSQFAKWLVDVEPFETKRLTIDAPALEDLRSA